MKPAVSNSPTQSAVPKYDIFWQLWPQFDTTGGEHRQRGVEVELIGSHTSNLDHVDFTCRTCHSVRSALLGIAYLVLREAVFSRDSLTYRLDSHSNSILCLPAWGNRAAVSVSIYVSWNGSNGQAFETAVLSEVKTLLASRGIHQH